MNTVNKTFRILGAAFLLQFVTSFTSGVFLKPTWLVEGNIVETMTRVANNPWLIKVNILVDMLTALGIILLGVMLFVALRDQNEPLALTALGFYLIEAALLGVSRGEVFSLITISQEYVNAGQPAYLQSLANLAIASADFVGFTLHMLVFCPGAILFYFLMYKSGIVPRAFSLWGLITVVPLLIATLVGLFDYPVPFVIAVPYVPFEFVIGVWILGKGIQERSKPASMQQAVTARGSV